MHAGLELPFRFDPHRLKADLALVDPAEWRPHYNLSDYEGDWRGAALRSSSGDIATLTASFAPASNFLDTPLMSRCAYFREAVSAFACPLRAVRLLALAPGSFIREHTDHALVYEDGEMRVHIPVQTAPEVEFYVSGERLLFEEGHCYYVNVNLPHRITNRSRSERIHLVIDLQVNDWVHRLVREARAQGRAIPRSASPPGHFGDFASHVFTNPGLRDALQSISDRAEFISAALRAARESGFDLLQPDIEAALPRQSTADPKRRASCAEITRSKLGWTPIGVYFDNQQPRVEWIYSGSRALTEPFFEQTVRDCLSLPFTVAFRQESRLDALAQTEGLAPSGFIFHSSRCGSTLVAQMLASLPYTTVLSEPQPIDHVLQAHLQLPDLTFEHQATWLRRMILALGQRRTGSETHYFLKLDCWHIHRLPLLRAAFPETPCLFLFRNPFEILHSQALCPGLHALPGAMGDPRAVGLTLQDIPRLQPDEWCARVLANIFQSALQYSNDPQMMFVDYTALPEALFGSIARHFSVPLSATDAECMRNRAQFQSQSGSPWPQAPQPYSRSRTLPKSGQFILKLFRSSLPQVTSYRLSL